ncbi:MAG: helix-turn-helix transcriptional regulator, partial [Clostridia bacterium]|nr:helix-turn-helix transcriptional regulator [Clostridia bacterium]
LREMEELTAIMSTIILRRQELGWSQRELAKRCGMPQSSIARMETGVNFPRVDTLAKVLRELGLTLVVQPAS